jgi:hypothetical protein
VGYCFIMGTETFSRSNCTNYNNEIPVLMKVVTEKSWIENLWGKCRVLVKTYIS